jgi:hypothetical protein
MQRIATRTTILTGSLGSAGSTAWTFLDSAPQEWLHLMLTHLWLLSGFFFALLGLLAQLILRLRLRALFRSGLTLHRP